MSTTVKTGWLHDKNGDKFAPKTLISQVQTNDGSLLEDKIQSDLEAVKTEIFESINNKEDTSHNHDNEYYTQVRVDELLEGKSDSGHTHSKDTITSVYEANLLWGGKHIQEAITPIDAATSSLHSANRFAFSQPEGITIEYSNDGGTSWIDYGASDLDKVKLVSNKNIHFTIGKKNTGDTVTVDDKLRITLNATSMNVYTLLRKLLINLSTVGAEGTHLILELSNFGSEDVFTTLDTYDVSGWPAWNSIPVNCAFGGGANQPSNIAIVRLTFGITGVSTTASNLMYVGNIIAIGDNSWIHPSEMARTGHLYTYDVSQNATFPATIKAESGFIGELNGNASSATKATQDSIGNVIADTYETKTDAETKLETHNSNTAAHSDIREQISQLSVQQAEPNYELIETIILNESVAQIERNTEPDGTAYNLKNVIIEIMVSDQSQAVGTITVSTYFVGGETITKYGVASAIAASSVRYVTARVEKRNGVFESTITNPGWSRTSMTSLYMQPGVIYEKDNNIGKFRIIAATDGVPIPTGSEIKIWAVRA